MSKPWYLVAWLLVIELAIVLILVPGDLTSRAIEKEAVDIKQSLGQQSQEWVHDKAERWYQSTMMDSGFYAGMHRTFIPTKEEKMKSKGLENFGSHWFTFIEGRIESFTKVVYQFYTRIALFTLWMPYILVLLVPAIFDGLMTWKIKRTNFDYASPVIHRYSTRAVSYIVIGAIVLSFVPIAITPMLMPLLMMLWSVFAGLMIGNFQKRV